MPPKAKPQPPDIEELFLYVKTAQQVMHAIRKLATMTLNQQLMENGWLRGAMQELSLALEAYDELPKRRRT